MKFSTNTIVTGLSLLLLTSCTSLDVLKKKNIHGNNFNTELARDYLKFADKEARQYDWVDSDHFAKKGIAASKGTNVLPEDLAKWDLKSNHRAELTHARSELVATLTSSNKHRFPKEAADAQAFFDCWVEEQEENWQPNDIVYCKKHYQDAIAKLHHVIKTVDQPTQVEVIRTEPKHEEKIEHIYKVHFDFDKADIVDSERHILDKIAKAHIHHKSKIHIDGYADDTGSDEYNDKLSLRRAESVKNYLTNSGVNKDVFDLHYHGKHHLAVKTPHGVKERANRRVEINLN